MTCGMAFDWLVLIGASVLALAGALDSMGLLPY